ncbi:MAG: protealysin inhibitor emfourin [Streptosporangiales bacterium]
MRVEVRRSGGVAGITRHGATDFDDASGLAAALDSAVATAPEVVPDTFTYQVSIDDRQWTVEEHALPANVRSQLETVLE